MLLRCMFLAFILSLLTVTLLDLTLFMGKAVLFERALGFVPNGYQNALSVIQQSFSSGTYVAPTTAPATCVSNDSPCHFYASETVTVPSQTAPQASTACSSSSTNCATNLQEHVAVSEGRMALRVSITIFDSDKSPILTRTKFLTLRTFNVAPYLAVIGERDGAISDRATAPEGENAGAPLQASPGPDPSASPIVTQAATQIVVKYHDTTGASPDAERDTWATQGWSSGNSSPSAWSP